MGVDAILGGEQERFKLIDVQAEQERARRAALLHTSGAAAAFCQPFTCQHACFIFIIYGLETSKDVACDSFAGQGMPQLIAGYRVKCLLEVNKARVGQYPKRFCSKGATVLPGL